MKILRFMDFPRIEGFDIYQSAVLGYNKITTKEDCEKILTDYNKFIDVNKYLKRMKRLIAEKEFITFIKSLDKTKDVICVIGDYDCDGIFATVIMVYALMLCGYKVIFTIPDRFEDGYGMHKRQVDIGLENGATVFITVDNGITTNDVIDYIHQKKARCLVTDHHTPQGENNADVCIDPLYNKDEVDYISGACVAMKLAVALQEEFKFDIRFVYDFIALAYLTTYSDQMPIRDENRWLIQAGERYCNAQVNIKDSFINRLAKMLDFYNETKKSDEVLELDCYKGFNKDTNDFDLIPKINAMNRVLGDVTDLPYDIMCLWGAEYNGIPHFYSGINKKRKYMKSELINKHKVIKDRKAIVEVLQPDLWDDNYSGIAGLAASDAVENEHIPALIGVDHLNSKDTDIMHFSGRTPSGFNLFKALTEIKTEHPELKLNFGGHAEALGASCMKCEIPLLEQYLGEKFSVVPVEDREETYFEPDAYQYMLDAYLSLWPYGNKFEFPKLYIESEIDNLQFKSLVLKDKRLQRKPIYFFFKEDYSKLKTAKDNNKKVSLVIGFMQNDNNDVVLRLDKIITKGK